MEAPAATALPPTPTATVIPTPTEVPPPEFKVIGEYRTSGSANGLFVVDNSLYLANGADGVLKLDVSDQANPGLLDTYPIGELAAQRLFIDNEIAYVIAGDHFRKLVALELETGKTASTFPSEGTGMGSLYNIIVADNLAHLTGHNYWGILDVRDPVQPVEMWQWEPPSHSGNPCNATVDGSLAYISCGSAGLFIFDITDPQKPELLGQFETPNWIIDLTLAGQVLYLTLGESGLLALDVSDPARPLLLSRLNLPGFSARLSVSGEMLYILYIVYEGNVTQASGVRALNVSDPEAMEVVATYDKLNWPSDIQAIEEDIYVADESRGVMILNLEVLK
jgi:hypothetical protein